MYQKFLMLGLALITIVFSLTSVSATSSLHEQKQFLSLADLHFDPFISCNATIPCPLIKKLQQTPANQWGNVFSKQEDSKSSYGEDSNYFLIQSSLDEARKAVSKKNLQFVLVLGDLLTHNFKKKYKKYAVDKTKTAYIAFVKKTLQFLTLELKHSFPNTSIYLVVGNNDSYQGDYASVPGGLFFKDLSLMASTLIKSPPNKAILLHEFPQGGYYALTLPGQSRLRLMILNSVFFSKKSKGFHMDKAARAELNWLQSELMSARQKHQKVIIAMHIPTGIDLYSTSFNPFRLFQFWRSSYSQEFLSEVEQYAPEIMGVFTAHIHRDTFQMLMTKSHHAVPFAGTPSISPIFGNNPGFKIFSYSLPSLKLSGIETFYCSLNNHEEWNKEYNVDEVYQLNHSEAVSAI